MTQVDDRHHGGSVELAVGETLVLRLSENPTTGFRWQVRSVGEPACELAADDFVPGGLSPGQGGSHTWQFSAVAPGEGTIQLAYQRSWEKQAAQEFRLTVKVS